MRNPCKRPKRRSDVDALGVVLVEATGVGAAAQEVRADRRGLVDVAVLEVLGRDGRRPRISLWARRASLARSTSTARATSRADDEHQKGAQSKNSLPRNDITELYAVDAAGW